MESIKSIGTPGGRSNSTCGYCSPPGERSADANSWRLAELDAIRLYCDVYQKMIDRGWRRSGTYCSKPDLRRDITRLDDCFRLDALALKPSKSQRKLINRWNRFVLHGMPGNDMDIDGKCNTQKRAKNMPTFSLTSAIHSSEQGFHDEEHPAHMFEVVLEPSSYTSQKFSLYRKYQSEIHNDHQNTPEGFTRFLVDSPLVTEPIPYTSTPPSHLPTHYGSYHQLYKLDGQLIAMAILDILPYCVSSVYFMYDKTWEQFSMGKLSALREASLAREMREAGLPDMGYLYMGFYVHSCKKMRYKGEYHPSYLADPETYNWFPLEHCLPLLERYHYACFSKPENSVEDTSEDYAVFANVDPPEPGPEELREIRLLYRAPGCDLSLVPINQSKYWQYSRMRPYFVGCIHGLGADLAKEIVFAFQI